LIQPGGKRTKLNKKARLGVPINQNQVYGKPFPL
jgi:hypothetical protein